MFGRALVLLFSIILISPNISSCDDGDDTPPADVNGDSDTGDTGSADAVTNNDADIEQTCWSCHGQPDAPNPPPNLNGSTDRTEPGVGAHAQHLAESDWHAQLLCRHCHTVPEAIDDAGHIDGERPADVVFSGLAVANLEATREGDTCVVFCHGATLHAGATASPAWTSQTPMACDGCHGMPPAWPHPESDQCGDCHKDMFDESGRINRPSVHINAELMAPHHAHLPHLGGAGGTQFPCDTCHDGDFYHGPLNDGHFLDETTVCTQCHSEGTVSPEDWLDYVWPSTDDR